MLWYIGHVLLTSLTTELHEASLTTSSILPIPKVPQSEETANHATIMRARIQAL